MTKRISFLAVPALLACLTTAGCQHQWASKSEAAAETPNTRPTLVVKDETSATQSAVIYRPGTKDMYEPKIEMPKYEPVQRTRSMAVEKTVTIDSEPVVMNMSASDSRVLPVATPRIDTLVGRKVNELHGELLSMETLVNKHDSELSALQISGDNIAGQYYSLTGILSAQLQSGTTPGNPEMVDIWNKAGTQLENLAASSKELGMLAGDVANTASKASFLLDATQATFGLSGAIEEDHENLTALEDLVNQDIVRINRMLNVINDEINRRNSYLRTERLNMQTLSLAVANGELYGHSMSSRLFSRVADSQDKTKVAGSFGQAPVVKSKRPLVIIRFDRPNVQYEQPLYTALSQAMNKYPTAQFDVVAVSPQGPNPAETALASAESRKHSEAVLRAMTQMGVPTNRIHLGKATTPGLSSSEVHLFIKQ